MILYYDADTLMQRWVLGKLDFVYIRGKGTNKAPGTFIVDNPPTWFAMSIASRKGQWTEARPSSLTKLKDVIKVIFDSKEFEIKMSWEEAAIKSKEKLI